MSDENPATEPTQPPPSDQDVETPDELEPGESAEDAAAPDAPAGAAAPDDQVPDEEATYLQEPAEGEARPNPYIGDDVRQDT